MTVRTPAEIDRIRGNRARGSADTSGMKLARHPRRPAVVLAPARILGHLEGLVREVGLTMGSLGFHADDATWREAGALAEGLAAALRGLQSRERRRALALREAHELDHGPKRAPHFKALRAKLSKKERHDSDEEQVVGRDQGLHRKPLR
jgi:hypothetical protein